MVDRLGTEIRKFEVRLEGFAQKKDEYVEKLRGFLKRLKELEGELKGKPGDVETLKGLRLTAYRALDEALAKGSAAEHEGSHLLESYGAVLLALEEEFQRIE